jgi:hypothetical protein
MKKEDYRKFLDEQYKVVQNNSLRKDHLAIPMARMSPGNSRHGTRKDRGLSESHLIPGINNLSTVGSAPMERGVHHIYSFEPRDNVYQVNGAG